MKKPMKRLYKSNFNKKITGVCGGLGEYFKIDPTIIRLLITFICIFTAIIPGILGYFIASLIIPQSKQKFPLEEKYRKLYKNPKDKVISGVCSGIGQFIHIDPVIIRIAFLFFFIVTMFFPLGITYIVGAMIIPDKPNDMNNQ